ncbi:MAG: hypothetical protein ACJA00_003079 [Myxococcota bacterium]|jgi:hypothetical protein
MWLAGQGQTEGQRDIARQPGTDRCREGSDRLTPKASEVLQQLSIQPFLGRTATQAAPLIQSLR